MFPTLPGGSNTVSNSSTMNGWLESTGLDDILKSTCSCFVEEEEPTSPPAQDKEGQKAGTTAEGKPLFVQLILGIGMSHFGCMHVCYENVLTL